jgi:alkane 1-monooxygenase
MPDAVPASRQRCHLFAGWGLVNLTGLGVFWWMGPIFLYLIPALDLVFGDDPTNPPVDVIAWLERDRYYRWITYLFLPAQYVAFFVGFWLIAYHHLGLVDKVGVAFTLGSVNGVAINTAHELGHKTERPERWFARIALAPTLYGHFFVEHNRGHHVRVATREDPASSRLGETFWRFLPRTVIGSLRNAWRLEQVRLRRGGKRTLSAGNDILTAWAMSAVLWATIIALFGVGTVCSYCPSCNRGSGSAAGRQVLKGMMPYSADRFGFSSNRGSLVSDE